jgi:hypothetical protein
VDWRGINDTHSSRLLLQFSSNIQRPPVPDTVLLEMEEGVITSVGGATTVEACEADVDALGIVLFGRWMAS